MSDDREHSAVIGHGLNEIFGNSILTHTDNLHIQSFSVESAEMWTDLLFLNCLRDLKMAEDAEHLAVVGHGLNQNFGDSGLLVHNHIPPDKTCAREQRFYSLHKAVLYL